MNRMVNELFKSINGLYVLMPDGRLGVYDEHDQFQCDAELTAALQEHNVQLLKNYLNATTSEQVRLGIIYPTRDAHPWKTETLLLEENVVRQIFPVGVTNKPLTAFQKKNQINSYYRAIENLINYQPKETPGMVFCPVLFDRGGAMDAYLPLLGRPEKPDDRDMPVLELLNLVADIPLYQRGASSLLAIRDRIHSTLIQNSRRSGSQFTLLDNVEFNSDRKTSDDAYGSDRRTDRSVTLSADELEGLHINQCFDMIEQWLEIPHRTIQAGELRRFVQFRELNSACLDVLAERSFVYTAPATTRLLEQGMTDNWNMYLLEGVLLLETADGQSLRIEGGTPKSETPVAFLKPRKYKVTTLTNVSFLWIHDILLRAVDDVQRSLPKLTPQTTKPHTSTR